MAFIDLTLKLILNNHPLETHVYHQVLNTTTSLPRTDHTINYNVKFFWQIPKMLLTQTPECVISSTWKTIIYQDMSSFPQSWNLQPTPLNSQLQIWKSRDIPMHRNISYISKLTSIGRGNGVELWKRWERRDRGDCERRKSEIYRDSNQRSWGSPTSRSRRRKLPVWRPSDYDSGGNSRRIRSPTGWFGYGFVSGVWLPHAPCTRTSARPHAVYRLIYHHI